VESRFVHGDDAEDFVDRTQELPLFAMGSQITFSPPEIETYYSVRMPELKLRRSGESRAPCPIHKGKGDNFAVKMETGEWFCQSQCQRGGDIIALEMALTGRGFATCKAEVFRIVGRTPEAHRNGTSPQGDPSEKSQRPTTNSGDPNPRSKLPATAHVVRQRLAKRGFRQS
jgi:CHC2 zinc finger